MENSWRKKWSLKNIYYVVGQEASLGFSYKSGCVCIKVGREAVRLLGWGVSEFHWIRGNVKVSFYLGTERM